MDTNQDLACSLLGPFSLSDAQGRSLLPKSKKAVGLLAYLLFHRGLQVSREIAADLFWSDRNTDQARASLRQTLLEIRRGFGDEHEPLLGFERHQLSVETSAIAFDFLGSFEDQTIYNTKELLHGVDPVAPVFDDWLDRERRSLRATQVEKLEELLHQPPGTANEVIVAAAEALLRLEPENEAAAQAAIKAYKALGKGYKAQELFTRFEKTLSLDELEVSQLTKDALAKAAPLAGPSLDGPIQITPTTKESAPAPQGAATGPPVVSLIQFTTLGPVEQSHCEFLNSAILARMGDVKEIRVAMSRNQSITEAQTDPDGPKTGYYLSGSIGLEGGQLFCNANILSAADGLQLGAIRVKQPFDEPISALNSVTDKMTARIVPDIEAIERRSLPMDATGWSSYQNYVFAKAELNRATAPDYTIKVEPYLRRAIEIEPGLSIAYPPLVSILNSRHRSTRPGHNCTAERDTALAMAKKALVFDSTNSNSQIALAWCLMRRREFGLAEQAAGEAVRLGPYEAARLNSLGSIFVLLGDFEKGGYYYTKAREVQVNDLDFQNTDLGELHYFQRNYDEAISYLTLGEARNPSYARIMRAAALAQKGLLVEARQLAQDAIEDMEARWEGEGAFSLADASRWFVEDFPLRRQMDYDNLVEGLTKAGFTM